MSSGPLRSWLLLVCCISIGIGILGLILSRSASPGSSAVTEKESIKIIGVDGGGFCPLDDSGVASDISWDREILLRASRDGGTYCSGFTFQVAFEMAQQRGLLEGKTYKQMKRFQKQWYGAEPGSGLRQAALAMETLGIGREIDLDDARPGDFVTFTRTYKSGHSVILLDLIRKDGKVIGLYYRSSQPQTDGIGNQTEYMSDTGYTNGTIRRETVVVGRMDE